MKKAIKICMLLLVMMLSFSLIALSASAATCEGTQEVNVALGATVTGDRGPGTPIDVAEDWIDNTGDGYLFWGVWDHFKSVVDGNVNTLCPCTPHNATTVGIRVTLDGPYDLSRVVIYPYGGEGRTESSSASQVAGAMDKQNGYLLKVWLYAGDGAEIAALSFMAEKEKIEINTADYGDIAQIYMYIEDYSLAQGIWEVEAWTKDTHNWALQEVTEDPECYSEGTATVKCSTCGEVADTIVKPTGHRDNCTGTCANGCGLSINIRHSKDSSKPCSDICTKCGVAGTVTASEGAFHVADSANPCSNTCVICGKEDVVPDIHDVTYWVTSKVPPFSYARHVENSDPCSTTCGSCGKTDAIWAKHIPVTSVKKNRLTGLDEETACGATECVNGCADPFSGGFYKDNKYHIRPEADTVINSGGATKFSCRGYCEFCGEYKLGFTHEFDNCGDLECNLCTTQAQIAQNESTHTFTIASPTKCTGCGYSLVGNSCEHTYDNICDNICNDCNAKRYGGRDAGGYPGEYWHVYTNSCDTTCNDCNAERTITHTYTYDCQQYCNVCKELTREEPSASHTYSEVKSPVDGTPIAGSTDCDTMCDVCLEERDVPHVLQYPCSPICTKCFAKNKTPHTYDNDCDKECNVCKATRTTSHTYLNVCDATCESCGEVRTAETDKTFDPDHDYDNACDAECNVCKATRTVEAHKYDNDCDTKCNVCDAQRTVEDHTYDNACDATCNKCNAERSVAGHAYDNDCDTSCNTCGTTRETAHDFGAWITSKEATKDEAGEEKRFCNKCQFVEVRETPMLEGGLGVGAIIGIVAGSVAVLGGGGFCLWWFVIRKKFN